VPRDDHSATCVEPEAFNALRNLAASKQPADPAEWRIDAQIVGAVICSRPIPILLSRHSQHQYFDSHGDAASNYGSAGAGMAHEISHSFDELGNIYDDQGDRKWWTADDLARYTRRLRSCSANFDGYCPLLIFASMPASLSENIPTWRDCRWRMTLTSCR